MSSASNSYRHVQEGCCDALLLKAGANFSSPESKEVKLAINNATRDAIAMPSSLLISECGI